MGVPRLVSADSDSGKLPNVVNAYIAETLSQQPAIATAVKNATNAAVPPIVDTYLGTSEAVAGAVTSALGGTRRAGVPLTLAAGASGNVDTATAKLQRFPFKLPATTKRWRVHGRNYNDRDNITYTGSLAINGIWFGRAEVLSGGVLSGNMTATPTKVVDAFTTPADGTEFVTPWVDTIPNQFQAYTEHMISMGYTGAAQNNHRGIGAVWTGTDPARAGDRAPSGLTLNPASSLGEGAPVLDLWVEVEVASDVPICAYLGDSLTVGTNSTYPIRDSYAMKHAMANGVVPTFRAAHGSSIAMWTDASAYKWTKYDGTDAPDATFWAMGSNDIFNDTPTLAQMQGRFQNLLNVVRTKLSTNIYLATVMPRNGSASNTDKEASRVAYNDWLLGSLPGGARNVFDFAQTVSSAPGVLDSRYVSSDGVHLNSGGYARNAAAITGSLAARNRVPAVQTVTVPALPALPVTGWSERWRADQIKQNVGDTVNYWEGVGGLALSTTISGWTPPVLASGDGGRRVVRFNGTSDGMQSNVVRAAGHTVVVRGRVRAVNSASVNILVGAGDATPSRGSVFLSTTGTVQANAGSTLTLSSPSVDTNTHTFIAVFNGANGVIALDSSEVAGSVGTENPNVLYVGRWVGGNATALDVEELLVYPRSLTGSERASLVSAFSALV